MEYVFIITLFIEKCTPNRRMRSISFPLGVRFIIISRTRWNVKRCWMCVPIIIMALEDMENSISLVFREVKRRRQRGKRDYTRRHLLHQTSSTLRYYTHTQNPEYERLYEGKSKRMTTPSYRQREAYTDKFPNDNEQNFFIFFWRIHQVATATLLFLKDETRQTAK